MGSPLEQWNMTNAIGSENSTSSEHAEEIQRSLDSYLTFLRASQPIFSIFGILGNASILLLVIFVRELRSRCHALLANLTIANIINLFSALVLVVIARGDLQSIWIAIAALWLLQRGSSCVAIVTLTSLSVERYLAIVKPFVFRQRGGCIRRFFWGSIVVSWLIAAAHYLVYHYLQDDSFARLFLGYLIAMLIVPLPIMVYCYSCCARVLLNTQRKLRTRGNVNSSDSMETKRRQRDRLLVIMVFSTTLVFVASRVPLVIESVLLVRNAENFSQFRVILWYLYVIGDNLCQCLEPVLWYIMSTPFRDHLKRVYWKIVGRQGTMQT